TALRWSVGTLGHDFDEWCHVRTRSFGGSDDQLVEQIRHRPSRALEYALASRLRRYPAQRIAWRTEIGERLAAALPAGYFVLGGEQRDHCHWVFPVVCERPDALVRCLHAAGSDASCAGVTRIAALEGGTVDPTVARAALAGAVFVPIYPQFSARTVRQLERVLAGLPQ
ncbi:MAG: hypothetical protein H7123_09655, partial [Thermoleophilia bacterium]|nr:hypothetical protein [Thermoleophilia bacterium]